DIHPIGSPDLNVNFKLCQQRYGEVKSKTIFQRYGWNSEMASEKSLSSKQIEQLKIGMSDINANDLQDFLSKIVNTDFTSNHLYSIAYANLKHKEDFAAYNDIAKLPPHLFNDLINALSDAVPELHNETKGDTTVDKISGFPEKYFKYGIFSFRSGRSSEDHERLSLYSELKNIPIEEKGKYCEIMSKILAKKHMFLEDTSETPIGGILVPGMTMMVDGKKIKTWYKVEEIMDPGYGKMAYRLVPATEGYPEEMPDLIIYRSTASLPTSTDSMGTIASDINPFQTPGYLSRNKDKEKELDWLTRSTPSSSTTKQRPLLITGHSLGGSLAQIALSTLQQEGKWPERTISVELFDSPAISESDTESFAKWYKKDPVTTLHPLSIHYHISEGDPVPKGGIKYLGENCGNIASVSKKTLTETGRKNHEVAIKASMPGATKSLEKDRVIGAHSLIWLRGKKDSDYNELILPVEDYNKEMYAKRLLINSTVTKIALYASASIITVGLFPAVLGLILLKRAVWGRRGHGTKISALFNSNLPSNTEQRKETSSKKNETKAEKYDRLEEAYRDKDTHSFIQYLKKATSNGDQDALKKLEKLGEERNNEANFVLGEYYSSKQNVNKAFEYYKKAAYGYEIQETPVVFDDGPDLRKKKSSTKNTPPAIPKTPVNRDALFALAEFKINDKKIQHYRDAASLDHTQALKKLKEMCESNNDALLALVDFYSDSKNWTHANYKQEDAINYLTKAVSILKSEKALLALGELYTIKYMDEKKHSDFLQATNWYNQIPKDSEAYPKAAEELKFLQSYKKQHNI
ncbi:hypothetical protein N9Y92_00660, partial [Chlamydiales bacterium]|nr:hypothetical protein [Chlamydiales bacterium]